MGNRLAGKVAVVTGAGSGIGLATARRFAAEGAKVVCGDADDEAGSKAATEVGGLCVTVDVTSEPEVRALFQAAVDEYGGVDIAFNNAGISPPDDDSILTTELDAWRRVQDVNLTSVYLCCKYAIGQMRIRGGGSVINTASFVAVLGSATSQISYTASKGWRVGDEPGTGRSVRPRTHPGQRVVPGTGEYDHVARALRQGPGACGPPPRTRSDGSLRGGGRDRGSGHVPRQRRRVIRHCVDLPSRRRYQRRLRDAALAVLRPARRFARPVGRADRLLPRRRPRLARMTVSEPGWSMSDAVATPHSLY
jgi:hypothetical protein